MRVIAKSRLKNFLEVHRDCEQQLLTWFKIVKRADWRSFQEIKKEFGTCKDLGADRIIFKSKGNRYRLVIKVTFIHQIIWIRFIGTHEEYDRIDPKII